MKTCQKPCSVTEKKNLFDILFHPAVEESSVNKSEYFAAPEECERLAKTSKSSFGETFVVHYCTFKKENEKPITCFKLGKDQCQGEPLWWEKISLKSVQEWKKRR